MQCSGASSVQTSTESAENAQKAHRTVVRLVTCGTLRTFNAKYAHSLPAKDCPRQTVCGRLCAAEEQKTEALSARLENAKLVAKAALWPQICLAKQTLFHQELRSQPKAATMLHHCLAQTVLAANSCKCFLQLARNCPLRSISWHCKLYCKFPNS